MEQSKFYQIKNITEQEYTLVGCDGSVITRPILDVDKSATAFTIQDAKDGDVLVCPKYAGDIIPNIFIFKNIERKDNDVFCHCSFLEKFRTEGYVANADPINTDFYPATKEQRDTLMKAMADAGYTFDFNKKELKKIPTPKFGIGDYVKNVNDKREPIYEIVYMDNECYVCEYRGKENMGDKTVMHFAFDCPYLRHTQKPAWSEEDERNIKELLYLVEANHLSSEEPHDRLIKFLESLRPNHWKPSDEQMRALESSTENCAYSEYQVCLRELIGQLKKLREE